MRAVVPIYQNSCEELGPTPRGGALLPIAAARGEAACEDVCGGEQQAPRPRREGQCTRWELPERTPRHVWRSSGWDLDEGNNLAVVHPDCFVANQIVIFVADSEETGVSLRPAFSEAFGRDNYDGVLHVDEGKLFIN